MGTSRAPATKRHGGPTTRVGGLEAMRAVAHPTRVRIMHLLRAEPLSASELSRRLGIRVGSAQYHLRTLERAGIARRGERRSRRGGMEILYTVPHGLGVDVDADAPKGLRQAMHRAYLAELLRRLDASADDQRPGDTDRDVLSTRDLELRPQDLALAEAALHDFLERLNELAVDVPTEDSIPFSASVQFFRLPRSASAWSHLDPRGKPAPR